MAPTALGRRLSSLNITIDPMENQEIVSKQARWEENVR